jgi:hypothetical protein
MWDPFTGEQEAREPSAVELAVTEQEFALRVEAEVVKLAPRILQDECINQNAEAARAAAPRTS